MENLKSKLEEAVLKLVRARDAVKAAQQEFDSLYAQIGGRGSEKPPADFQPAAGGSSVKSEPTAGGAGTNYTEQIVTVMRAEPKRKWKYAEIAQKVPGIKIASLRPLLGRLAKTEPPLVVKTGRGKYKLADLV